MSLPKLAGVQSAIAGEKLVAAIGLDHANGRVRPGKTIVLVGEWRLCLLPGFVALLCRSDRLAGNHLGRTRRGESGRCALGSNLFRTEQQDIAQNEGRSGELQLPYHGGLPPVEKTHTLHQSRDAN